MLEVSLCLQGRHESGAGDAAVHRQPLEGGGGCAVRDRALQQICGGAPWLLDASSIIAGSTLGLPNVEPRLLHRALAAPEVLVPAGIATCSALVQLAASVPICERSEGSKQWPVPCSMLDLIMSESHNSSVILTPRN